MPINSRYTLWKLQAKPPRRACDPQTRAMQGKRFRYMYTRLGYTAADVAKFLQVSERTVHNWVAGSVRVPHAAYKLLRIHLRYELPGDGWQGWHFSAGKLWTPEGHSIDPTDWSWWSLMARKAASFGRLYEENGLLKEKVSRTDGPPARDALAHVPVAGASGRQCRRHGRRDGAAGLDLSLQHFGTQSKKSEVLCGLRAGGQRSKFVTKGVRHGR